MLGSTDACWNAVIAQLDPDVYYVKLDDDIVYIQVPSNPHKLQKGGCIVMYRTMPILRPFLLSRLAVNALPRVGRP